MLRTGKIILLSTGYDKSSPPMNTAIDKASDSLRCNYLKRLSLIVGISVLLAGCMTAGQHRDAVQDNTASRLSAGKVQREIHLGMSGGQVAEALGSPNIVSTDENRREVWIYDKIATEVAYSKSEGGLSTLLFGAGASVGGGLMGNTGQAAGVTSQSQRTLTVVIKFDENKVVRDFSYHQSSF